MISNTKLKERIRKKTNRSLVEVIKEANSLEGWKEVGKIFASSTRRHPAVNLSKVDKIAKEGDTIVVPGKILSFGELTKKVRLCAFSISERAMEKLKNSKSEFRTISEEIKKNPKAEGIKLVR